MSTFLTVFVFAIPFITIFAAIYAALRTMKRTGNSKKAMKRHLGTLITVFVLCICFSMAAYAESPDGTAVAAASSQIGLSFLAAALSVGLGGIGGGIALAGGAPAAIGATSEDPKAFGKALIFVALGEAVALYGFVIAFLIWIKLPSLSELLTAA